MAFWWNQVQHTNFDKTRKKFNFRHEVLHYQILERLLPQLLPASDATA